jgi:serine/threonine protein kinase
MVGKHLEHYEILEQIGEGGMGQVYRARDTKLGRHIALKVLPPDLSDNSERLRRFLHEARAVAAMNHPNIVTIHSIEESEGIHFLTMELIEGTALHKRIPENGLVLDELLKLALPLVDALSAAHELGVVHRDLKPSNVMLGRDGRLKVLDFGLATFVGTKDEPDEDSSELKTRTALTGEGMMVGTMPYMSPEQIESKPVDPRSDLFSLGIVLYEMAAGRRPFHGDTAPALMSSIMKDVPPPVSALNPVLPADLSRVIGRCLEKDPARRYPTAREVHAALEALPRQAVGVPAESGVMPAAGARPASITFAHDLYISYAHLDNEAQLSGQEGWVSSFHRSLEVRVGQLLGKKPVIWRNPKMHGEDALDDSQIEHIPNSALLITLLSPRYVKSEWCHKELQKFLEASSRTGGPKWGSRFRVFKVVKTPTPVERHPSEIQPLPGYEFFTVDPQSGRPRELDQIFGPEAQREYWARLDDLAHDIVEMLETMEERLPEGVAQEEASSTAPVSEKGVIYLAQTTHDLNEEHVAMRRDLQRHGYTILPEGPLPLVDSELQSFVRDAMDRARMSIHLVGRNYGVVPEGASDSVVALQNDLALQRVASGGFQRVVWIPDGVSVEDDRQPSFLERLRTNPRMQEHCELLETPFEDLKTVVHQILEPPARRSEPRVQEAGDEISRIYLICDQRDQEAGGRLADLLFDRGFEVTLPVFEGDEAEIREDHEDNLRLCDGVLLYYGAGNELWLRRKLREVQKSPGLGRTKVIRAKGIWVAPPATAQKQRLRTREALVMSGTGEMTPEPLQPFLDALGGARAGG